MDPAVANTIFLIVLLIWSLFWKGLALWRAAKLGQRNWFIFILVINSIALGITFGLLEIVYLLRFAKKRLTLEEMKGWKDLFVTKVPDKKKK